MSNVNIAKLFQSARETSEPEVAEIKGKIPSWLKGKYCRVGPSLFDLGTDFCMNHLLDGYALLTKFEVCPEFGVKVEKKFLQSSAYTRAIVAEKPVITEFATHGFPDPKKSFFSKCVSALHPEFTDNDYSTLFTIGKDIFSTSDTCFFRQVDLDRLGESPEKLDTNKYFGLSSQSAHPLTDPVTGDTWTVGVTLFTGLKYHVVKIPAVGLPPTGNKLSSCGSSKEMLKKAKTIATIPSRWNGAIASMHSFGMSQSHIVLIEQPFVASVAKLCTSLVKKNAVKDWIEWRGEDKTRFMIVSKKDGKVYKTDYYSTDSFYYMHTINCYEDEEGQIILDMITYPSPSVLDAFYLENLRKNKIKPSDLPQCQRFIIPLVDDIKLVQENVNLVKGTSLSSSTMTMTTTTTTNSSAKAIREGHRIILTPQILIEERGFELPCINRQDKFGKKYKYFYASGTINQNSFRNKICKFNTETGDIIYFKENDHVFPGEPCFIKDPQGLEEDDGVILSVMSDTRDGVDCRDFLIFLDKNMKEMARAIFPTHQIPNGLHGIFLQE